MESYEKFKEERKKLLKNIFKGKSQNWIDSNISYHYFKKLNILNDIRFKKIIESLHTKLDEKIVLWLLYLIEYSYVPQSIITNYFPKVITPSKDLELRGLVKYYIFQVKNNIFISFRGTKTLWETISALKFYRVKFNILSPEDNIDFFSWRDNTIDNKKIFNSDRIPLSNDNDIEIHKGFLDEANHIYTDVVEKVSAILDPSCHKSHIVLCGHSLGGVMANIIGIYLAYYLKKAVNKDRLSLSIVTANTPPIGNKNFNLLIPYLKIRNYVRFYNYQDFIPYYGYYGSWIESKKFRHLDFMLKNGIDSVDNVEGRFLDKKINKTKIWVKDYGKNLDFFLKKIQMGKDDHTTLNKKYIYHDFFSVIKKNKLLFI